MEIAGSGHVLEIKSDTCQCRVISRVGCLRQLISTGTKLAAFGSDIDSCVIIDTLLVHNIEGIVCT